VFTGSELSDAMVSYDLGIGDAIRGLGTVPLGIQVFEVIEQLNRRMISGERVA